MQRIVRRDDPRNERVTSSIMFPPSLALEYGCVLPLPEFYYVECIYLFQVVIDKSSSPTSIDSISHMNTQILSHLLNMKFGFLFFVLSCVVFINLSIFPEAFGLLSI